MSLYKTNTDVTIIGCGPAGLIAAKESAKNGVSVIAFEEHEEIGKPCHCAGLISIWGLKKLAVPLDDRFVLNKLKGAYFYSSSKLSFKIERRNNVACVIDRTEFDKYLAEQALKAGVKINLGKKINRIRRHSKSLSVGGQWGQINSSVVIDAEGVGSRISRQMGLRPLNYDYVMPALQFELTDINLDEAYAEIHLNQKLTPNFFTWIIPLNEKSARVGLATNRENLANTLENFVKSRFGNFNVVSTSSGQIITCGPIKKTFTDNLIVVGDAAGQVKPTTGGGVVMGGICAGIAGKTSAFAVKNGTLEKKYLRKYEQSWKKEINRELTLMSIVRRIINLMSDETINQLFQIIIKKNYEHDFSLLGDMDFQSSLILALIKKRDLMNILFKMAPNLISQEIKRSLINE